MRFRTIDYLEWAKRTHDVSPVRYDLSTSAVRPAPAEMLGPLDGIPIAGNNAFGHPGLRAALAARYGVPEERILCSVAGTSSANFLLAAALVAPGDPVLVEWPCYEPLWRTFEALGARIEWLERPIERRCALDLDALERALVRGARAVAISNPMNPTGLLLDPAEVLAAGRLAARHGAHVIVDEIYMGAFDGPRARSSARAEDGSPAPGIVVTASLTKAYGLGGLRAGWAVAPPALVRRAYEVLDYLAVEQCYVGDVLALRALERIDALRARADAIRRENAPVLERWAASRAGAGGGSLLAPEGGFTALFELPRGFTAEGLEAPLRALETAVAPGTYFGLPRHVRIGTGAAPEVLAEGLARLSRVLDAGPPASAAVGAAGRDAPPPRARTGLGPGSGA
jgi:hypothetical protein